MQTIEDLMSRFPRAGRVEWIGIASQRGGAIRAQPQVELSPGTGIAGEHHWRVWLRKLTVEPLHSPGHGDRLTWRT